MIEEDYVDFETTNLLKEKGFDNDVICTDCWYDEDGMKIATLKTELSVNIVQN